MIRSSFPTVIEQAHLYRRILEQANGKPVVFRTLDIGGDKLLPYMPETIEENPAMGWRAIRIALDHPTMLRHQLRALILGSFGQSFSVMFPMVAEAAELIAAKGALTLEIERARRRGRKLPEQIRVGAMIEVPSLIFQLDTLCQHVDFVSVGSNDLKQFLFASDRGNPRLADRYDLLSPPGLRCLREILRVTEKAGVPVSICGEMAGNPLEAMALIGLGFRHLSMSPGAIGPVKEMVRSLDVRPLSLFLLRLLEQPDHSFRSKLRNYATDHGIVV